VTAKINHENNDHRDLLLQNFGRYLRSDKLTLWCQPDRWKKKQKKQTNKKKTWIWKPV